MAETRATGKTTRMIAQALAAISAQPEKTQYIVTSEPHTKRITHLTAAAAEALGWQPMVEKNEMVTTNFGGQILVVRSDLSRRFFRGVESGNIKYDL